jgi:hypothetical protein
MASTTTLCFPFAISYLPLELWGIEPSLENGDATSANAV